MRLCNQLKSILFFNFFATECDISNLEAILLKEPLKIHCTIVKMMFEN